MYTFGVQVGVHFNDSRLSSVVMSIRTPLLLSFHLERPTFTLLLDSCLEPGLVLEKGFISHLLCFIVLLVRCLVALFCRRFRIPEYHCLLGVLYEFLLSLLMAYCPCFFLFSVTFVRSFSFKMI